MYRCETLSLEGFIQQVATAYLPHGYYFYVHGFIPEEKSADSIDAKLIERYGIDISKWARCRRKKRGLANMQYIRYGRQFLLMATHGQHPFFESEARSMRDARKVPIRIGGYSVSVRWGPDGHRHSHVRIDKPKMKKVENYFLYHAAKFETADLAKELYYLPFEPYAPVRRQYATLLRKLNRQRGEKGASKLPYEILPARRRIYRPFGDLCTAPDGSE